MVDVQNNSTCGSSKSSEYLDFHGDKQWHCGPQLTQQLWQQSDQELGSGVVFYPSSNHPKGGMFQYGGNSTFTNILDINSFTWQRVRHWATCSRLTVREPWSRTERSWSSLALVCSQAVASSRSLIRSQALLPTPSTTRSARAIRRSWVTDDLPTGQIASEDYDTVIYLYNPTPGVVSGVAPRSSPRRTPIWAVRRTTSCTASS